jgi:hypothetical protein
VDLQLVKELKHDIDLGFNLLPELELELTVGVTGQ